MPNSPALTPVQATTERARGPGKNTTEHKRAARAEGVGFAVMAAGLTQTAAFAILNQGVGAYSGAAVLAIGAVLVAATTSSYSKARASVKAAAVLRPAGSGKPGAL